MKMSGIFDVTKFHAYECTKIQTKFSDKLNKISSVSLKTNGIGKFTSKIKFV
jgi:hypothetical protein